MQYFNKNTNLFIFDDSFNGEKISLMSDEKRKELGLLLVKYTQRAKPNNHQREVCEIIQDELNYTYSYRLEPLSKDEILKQVTDKFKQRVQSLLDEKAREKGYDDIVSACSYAGYENEFQAEAVAFGKWRAKVWQWGYSLLNQDIQTESIDIDEILKDMPEFE